jgi:hypothetical protein
MQVREASRTLEKHSALQNMKYHYLPKAKVPYVNLFCDAVQCAVILSINFLYTTMPSLKYRQILKALSAVLWNRNRNRRNRNFLTSGTGTVTGTVTC